MRSNYLLYLIASYITFINAQPNHIFFEYQQDSTKVTRSVNCNAPANAQTFSLNSSLVSDYVGNVRIAVITGIITGKKDTLLALHSLVNGAGNLCLEAEWPFWVVQTRNNKQRDFIGSSIYPRISTIITNQSFESSMISLDLGWNITGKFTGDLGNISLKYTLRNAICVGNNRFVNKAFGFSQNQFIYSSFQLKIRAGPNILSLTLPIYIYSLDDTLVKDLPVYVGYALMF